MINPPNAEQLYKPTDWPNHVEGLNSEILDRLKALKLGPEVPRSEPTASAEEDFGARV